MSMRRVAILALDQGMLRLPSGVVEKQDRHGLGRDQNVTRWGRVRHADACCMRVRAHARAQ